MITSNVSITKTWTKIAEDTDDPILIQGVGKIDWELAAVTVDAAPTVPVGHRLTGDSEAVTRNLIGSGFLYAKIASYEKVVSTVIVITK